MKAFFIKFYFILLSLSFISSNEGSPESLRYVIEISRHGIRAPKRILPYAEPPSANFNSTLDLMPKGQKQHFDLG
jgi:hypothetical protein